MIKGHPRSKISKKGQISDLDQIYYIIYENDALYVSFLIEGIWRSSKVTRGQKSTKRSNSEGLDEPTTSSEARGEGILVDLTPRAKREA